MCLVAVVVVIVVDDDVVVVVAFMIVFFYLPTSFLTGYYQLLFMYPMLLLAEFLYKFQTYMLVCVNLIVTFFITTILSRQ